MILQLIKKNRVSVPAAEATKKLFELADSWKHPGIPEQQWEVVSTQISKFSHDGQVELFEVLCNSVVICLEQLKDTSTNLLEIGCASGYNGAVLQKRFPELSYTGVDFSKELISFGKSKFQHLDLQVQDATHLDFPNGHFEIVVSGGVPQHIADWKSGIKESCRVARKYLIFHRTPITWWATKLFTKTAYDVTMFEWSFNEKEFIAEVESHGFSRTETLKIGSRIIDRWSRRLQVTYVFSKTI